MLQVSIGQRSLNRGDKKLALLKNRDFQMDLLPAGLSRIRNRHDFVSQEFLGLFNSALQIANGVHLSEIHTDGDEGLGNFRGKAGDDDGGTEEARSFDGLDEVVRDGNVHGGHTGDVDNDDFRTVGADAAKQLLRQLTSALRVNNTDDGENEQAFANLQDWRRELANCFLLLTDDAFAFLNETDGDSVGDAVRGGFVGIENAIELFKIGLVLSEEGASENVTEEEHDTDDFVSFNAARNNSFRKIAGISLEGFESASLERFHVAVVHRGSFGEDFLFCHGGEEPRFRNSAQPFFAKLSSILPKVSYQLAQKLRRRFIARYFRLPEFSFQRFTRRILTISHVQTLQTRGW